MVAHPDQTDLHAGQLRVAVSLRQIGEGHLSSIGFATAVLGPGHHLTVADRRGPLVVGQRMGVRHRRDLLAAGLAEEDCDNEVTATVLDALPERYGEATFERVLGDLPPDLLSRSTGMGTLERLRRTNAASYATSFPADTALHERVLWPATPAESNGMEDARFVRTVDESGSVYRATYTAYDGRSIATRALASRDLRRFEMTPMRGPGARSKGSRCSPCRRWSAPGAVPYRRRDHRSDLPGRREPVAGSGAAARSPGRMGAHPGRQLRITHRDRRGLARTHPRCRPDAPVRHRRAPARPASTGACRGTAPGALLAPDDADRNGYVPNVVYSCGGLVHAGELWLPYGASDARVGFATVPLAALLAAMAEFPPPNSGDA
ncbi:hypothetical protein GCM10027614_41800 [Micromonospora vulcania]